MPYVLTVVCTALLLVSEIKASRIGVWIFKPLASLGFLWAGFSHARPFTDFTSLMMMALVLCFLGDVLLIPHSKKIFLAGVGSFLLGHVAYGAAFIHLGFFPKTTLIAFFGIGVVTTLVARFLLPHLERKDPSMKIPVLLYMTVISTMVALSISLGLRESLWIFPLGAVIFYLSDLSVALEKFVSPGFKHKLWGLPLYYAAQLILASQIRSNVLP